jgi:hypothetical protein
MSSIEAQMIANDYYKLPNKSPLSLPNSHTQSQNNHRIYNRNIPSHPLQAYLNVRPVMTKYSILPILDPRSAMGVPMTSFPTYSSEQTFNPGNAVSPWSGFASNVNIESQLRNQICPLNKCNDDVYVPSSNSDMYQFSFNTNNNVNQDFEGLFHNDTFNKFNPNPNNLSKQPFYNNTRVDVKNLSKKTKCNK